ncbi:MAG TPA: hypothetical protein PK995_02970 [Bacteroidia bacterium]|mgnify:CR=1 FL=1|nr:hypothetical protein [Bacteroidia bacterium]
MKKLVLIALLNAGIVVGQGDLRNKINVTYPKNSAPKKEIKKVKIESSEVGKNPVNFKRSDYLDNFFKEIIHIDTLYSTYKLDSTTRLKYYAFFGYTVVKEIPKIFQNEVVESIKKAANFYSLYYERLKGIDIDCNSLLWYDLLKKGEVDLSYLKNKKEIQYLETYYSEDSYGNIRRYFDFKKPLKERDYSKLNDFTKTTLKYKVDIKDGLQIGDYILLVYGEGNPVVDTSIYVYKKGFHPVYTVGDDYHYTIGGDGEGHLVKIFDIVKVGNKDYVYALSHHIEKGKTYYKITRLIVDYEKELMTVVFKDYVNLYAISFKSANYCVFRIR